MALLNTWGSFNKIINSSKVVTYTAQKLFGQDYRTYGQNYDNIWSYNRNCTMNFEYVGMDLETAEECVTSLVQTFTRQTKISQWRQNVGQFIVVNAGSLLMSQISIQKMGGTMYKVCVSVSETDNRMSVYRVEDVSSLFTEENQRDYLEDED